jgi:guanylate kinase
MAQGKLIVLSAPSGAGKTTIAHEILRRNPGLRFSVSATTRPRRENESDGTDYHFLAREEFLRRVGAGEFVEWEEVYGNCYGTLRAEIDAVLQQGDSVLFDVDVKGGLSIRKHYPDALLIFIHPPDVRTLLERLRNRRTEDEHTSLRRMQRVEMEMELGKQFDHQVVNDTLADAVGRVDELVKRHLQEQCTTGGKHGDQTD